ncbi:hypothetical protein BDV28DRAFT_141091 [Aspergillus coremiiformis]|uniref:Secreted protein n=1 Tax=Aspergillus coremiiformis TaxID=138285 RepID=A0A5N6YVM9_9EURO|nr:hypothetical protein BDV28DRAFT_141091 [Aspergillus coremiiformis]
MWGFQGWVWFLASRTCYHGKLVPRVLWSTMVRCLFRGGLHGKFAGSCPSVCAFRWSYYGRRLIHPSNGEPPSGRIIASRSTIISRLLMAAQPDGLGPSDSMR